MITFQHSCKQLVVGATLPSPHPHTSNATTRCRRGRPGCRKQPKLWATVQCSLNATYIDTDVTGVVTAGPGPVIIKGHVGSSGVVRAAHSVVVLGTIRGSVHAGMMGDPRCTISALGLQAAQLHIADVALANHNSSGQVMEAQQGGMLEVSVAEGGQQLQVTGAAATGDGAAAAAAAGDAAAEGDGAAAAAAARWSRPALLAAITGCYAILAGLALTLAPVTVFGLLFNTGEVARVWIRVGGILFSLIGAQYLGTALLDRQGAGAEAFYSSSVWSRGYLVAAFLALVLTGQATWGVGLLAAINAVGALSMLRALQQQQRQQQQQVTA